MVICHVKKGHEECGEECLDAGSWPRVRAQAMLMGAGGGDSGLHPAQPSPWLPHWLSRATGSGGISETSHSAQLMFIIENLEGAKAM